MEVRYLGCTDYSRVWHAMQQFTQTRTGDSLDELWVTEHFPVYTVGINRREVRLPSRTDIPVVYSDRGGKITYHGPGQAILYPLFDLARRKVLVREFVYFLESVVIDFLHGSGIQATRRSGAPGVYVDGSKIAALGLRVRNGCCYHGLSVNVDMDLTPFQHIDPCGYAGLAVTQLRDLGVETPVTILAQQLSAALCGMWNN